MSDSVAVNLEPVKADAELMSAWLGGMDNVSISPKLLFDLQTLLRHYADFLVPNKTISVDYEYEGTPCASVDNNQVFIPLNMLKEGRVDETIAIVIHELHHIKFSDKESSICLKIMPFFTRILSTVEIDHYGQKMSIWQALEAHGNIPSERITTRTLEHSYKGFIYQYFGDLFLLLNAIEDVRIDELQPANLKKYRFKQEKNAFIKFQELYDSGELDKESLFGSFIDALFHLKGMGKSKLIENSDITKEMIVNVETPADYFQPVFGAFAKILQTHAGSLWKLYEEQESMADSAISDYLIQDSFDGDASPEVEGDTELSLNPIKSSDCPELDEELCSEVRRTFGEQDIQDLLTAMSCEPEDGEVSEGKLIMNSQLWAEIQAFSALQHIPCREAMQALPQGINYDTLILDCYA